MRISVFHEFFFIAVAFISLGTAQCVRLTLRPHASECFTEHPKEQHDTITGSFFLENLEGGNIGPENSFFMSVQDPTQAEIYNAEGKTEHRFEFKVNKAGMHKVCFTNKGDKTGKLSYFSHIGHHWDHGKAAKTHLDPAIEALQNLDAKVATVTEESRYHKRRARRHAETTKSTQKRVVIMALTEGAAMIASTFLQLNYVTKLFFHKDDFDQHKGSRGGIDV